MTGGVTGVVLIGRIAMSVLRGNTMCDDETSLKLSAGAPMPATEGDVICTDATGMGIEA